MNSKGKLASCGRGEMSGRNRQAGGGLVFILSNHGLCRTNPLAQTLPAWSLKPGSVNQVQRVQGAETETCTAVTARLYAAVDSMVPKV